MQIPVVIKKEAKVSMLFAAVKEYNILFSSPSLFEFIGLYINKLFTAFSTKLSENPITQVVTITVYTNAKNQKTNFNN